MLQKRIPVVNQYVTEKNSLRLQKEVDLKVLIDTSKLNENEEKLSKVNVRSFDKQMEWIKLKLKTLKTKIRKK